MNYEDLKKLLDYIQENNSWENMYECHQRNRYSFKYVRVYIDTRERADNEENVWFVRLENGGYVKDFRDATFEEIKKFLDLPAKEVVKQLEDKRWE